MLGSMMLHVLSERPEWDVTGTVRSEAGKQKLGAALANKLISGIDLTNTDHVAALFDRARPDVVVNCAGLTKHLPEGNAPIPALTVNALLPHRLSQLCRLVGARLVHVSTDCVFSGKVGNYRETDQPDASDVYGQTKHLGEVSGPGMITLRSSIIGPERGSQYGLLEWFLAQSQCKGFKRTIFSGLPTVEFSRLVRDVIIPRPELYGLYHVASRPIDKYSLLCLIARTYGKDTTIMPDDEHVLDRSLNADLFTSVTGYHPPEWPELVQMMHDYKI